MKLYLFITFSIIDVGGGQLYVRNKTEYMESQGWTVKIISAMEGDIIIPELRQYSAGIIKEIAVAPHVYNRIKVSEILNRMQYNYEDYSEIIIESHSFIFGLWGELLAKQIGAHHLLFTLEERNRCFSRSHLDFLFYKWKQKLLVGISPYTLHSFFASNGIEITIEESYSLPAYCQNTIEYIPSQFQIDKTFKTICLFGRLDKPFVKESANSIAKYIACHSHQGFNVVIIGGGDRNTLSIIENNFKDLSNCKILLTGYLFPVPYDLLSEMDVVVTSAGCSRVSAKIGITTITIDGNDLKPIGILGYTTNNSLFRENEPIVDLNTLLDLALFDEQYQSAPKEYQKDIFDFSGHMRFLKDLPKEKKYFDVSQIKISLKYIVISKLKNAMYNLLGRVLYLRLSNCKKSLVSR